jgi:hypothetical protein
MMTSSHDDVTLENPMMTSHWKLDLAVCPVRRHVEDFDMFHSRMDDYFCQTEDIKGFDIFVSRMKEHFLCSGFG